MGRDHLLSISVRSHRKRGNGRELCKLLLQTGSNRTSLEASTETGDLVQSGCAASTNLSFALCLTEACLFCRACCSGIFRRRVRHSAVVWSVWTWKG